MAFTSKLFSILVMLLFISIQGECQKCSVKDISVTITQTEETVEGAPEWLVAINNSCKCPQANVYVTCIGFNSYEKIDPEIFKVEGDTCLINGGKPIVKGVPVIFKFAFMTPFDLSPLKSTVVAC